MRRFKASSVFIVISSVTSFSYALSWTVLAVYYVTQVNMNPLQLVLVGTVVEGTVFLCEVPTGVVADTFSRRLSIIIGIFLTGIAFGIQGTVPEYWLVLVCQVIWGVGVTFISGAEDAWVADEVAEDQLGALFLRASQYSRVAALLGTVVSVGLASLNLIIPIVLCGVLFGALGVFLVFVMPETGFKAMPRGEHNSWHNMGSTFKGGVKAVRGRPLLITLLGISFFEGAASEGFDRLWEAHLLLNFKFPELGQLQPVVWFGIISIVGQILSFIFVSFFRKRVEAQMTQPTKIVRVLLLIQAFSVITIVVFGLAGNFWVALAALWAKNLAGSIGNPLYNTWLVQNIPSQVRATVLSMHSQTNAIGQVVGGPGVGAIGTIFSTRAAILVAGGLISPALVLYARLLRPKTVAPHAEEAEIKV